MADKTEKEEIADALTDGAEYGVAMMRVLQQSDMPFNRSAAIGAIYMAAMITKMCLRAEAKEDEFIALCMAAWRSSHIMEYRADGGENDDGTRH